ncbi:MAG: SUMF1/EgtB/PvdO family nonheme iron enzyme, partial [Candidatus Marinimicrobia bacterium]|nr:SUMF1/EgtB/PvdO family nonheme iron enzyme [Candidatus Neomarinimicrobiota bacterium]
MRYCLLVLSVLLTSQICSEELSRVEVRSESDLAVQQFIFSDGTNIEPPSRLPLVSFELATQSEPENRQLFYSTGPDFQKKVAADKIRVTYEQQLHYSPGVKGLVSFENVTADTLRLSNVVPFGASPNQVYISGEGDHPLSRTHLFRPGRMPVNCIVPDNAWELGFSAVEFDSQPNVCGLSRRINESTRDAHLRRFETVLYPGGSIEYLIYADTYHGPWQEGLRLMFQDRYLYDVPPGTFDNSMYQRPDLHWIRRTYASHLIMAWDNYYYDQSDQEFNLTAFEERNLRWFGGDGFIGVWPTWPTLGIDQRNQWDLYRDLPGGLDALDRQREKLSQLGSKLFISYNPWDESTRFEDHLGGMAEIIRRTDAHGVVLDTRGESSRELQAAADSVKKGVVMYSEGMAVPEDMQGIVAGRVHNALYYPPMMNLNKFIKPEFAIFRVAELYKEPIRREYILSLFNGYGTEMNLFVPGKPPWAEQQYKFWGKTLRILRENTANFTSNQLIPLIDTSRDSIWVNKWPAGEKVVYTIYSVIPAGYKDYLFEVSPQDNFHYVDVWHHKEIEPALINERWMIQAETSAFDSLELGTNNEGAVDCIVKFPEILTVSRFSDEVTIEAGDCDSIKVWSGPPDYRKTPLVLSPGRQTFRLRDHFGRYEGKFVVQAFSEDLLQDERIFHVQPGTPRLVSQKSIIEGAETPPDSMVLIPAGPFTFQETHGDEFVPYPEHNEGKKYKMSSFYMDKFPVTNRQFEAFLQDSDYVPADTANFLKHWRNGIIPEGKEGYPVVYISLEDARAYANWAGKRLPTEVEWQYAAQTSELNEWPWKQQEPVNREVKQITGT